MFGFLSGNNQTPNPVDLHIVQMSKGTTQERLHRWSLATSAYYGRLPNTLVVRPNKPNDNVRINYARLFVDKGAAFLFGKEVNFEIDDERTTPEETWLQKVWRKNRKMTFLNTLGVNGGIYGHVFVRILLPDPDDESKLPRLVALDPMTVEVTWDEDDIEEVTRYAVSYPTIGTDGKPKTKRQRYEQAEDGKSWDIYEEEARPEAGRQSHPDEDERITRNGYAQLSRETWPYPFAPIVHCQNLPAPNEFWGVADLEHDAIDLMQAMNFAMSNIRKVIRNHGSPKPLGSGFNAQQVKWDTDEMLILPNPEARITYLEMGGNMGTAMEFWKQMKASLHAVMRMPEVALGNLEGVGAVSGVALKIVYQPLLDKTESKRRTYGEMLEALNARLLVIGGFRTDHESVLVNTTWPEMLPRDEQVDRQTAQADTQLGVVSLETISGKLGYDFATEQKRMKAEKAAGLGPQPPTGIAPPTPPAPPAAPPPVPKQPDAGPTEQDMKDPSAE